MKAIRVILGFIFGLIAETCCRIVLILDDAFTVNFDYLRKRND